MQYNKNLTNSTLFLKPTLGIPIEHLDANNFINAYLDDISHDIHYNDCLYLLFKPSDFDRFNYFLSRERERITIVEDYDYVEYVVLVYRIPEQYLNDYQLFLEGKYSEFSEDLKAIFKGPRTQDKTSLQLMIINKDPKLKEYWNDELGVTLEDNSEVWGTPDLSKEVLDIDAIKKV